VVRKILRYDYESWLRVIKIYIMVVPKRGRGAAEHHKNATANNGMAAPETERPTLSNLDQSESATSPKDLNFAAVVASDHGSKKGQHRDHKKAGKAGSRHENQQRVVDKALKDAADKAGGYREATTRIYKRGVHKYKTAEALAKFNTWVELHRDEIDPGEATVCKECGEVDLNLCEHWVGAEEKAKAEYSPTPVVKTEHFWSYHIWDSIKRALKYPQMDLSVQNNDKTGGFDNSDISDNNIIPELYNYVKLRMQSSYSVNGVEVRNLRLEHCRRLATKWLEERKMEKKAEEDTVLTNRVMFTTQRVCDNAENRVLYGYTDPEQNFLTARLPLLKKWPKLLICFLLYALLGRIIMFAAPHAILFLSTYIVPGAVGNWVNLFIVTLRLLLNGSQHAFLGLFISPFTSIGVIVLCIAAFLTSLFSISSRR